MKELTIEDTRKRHYSKFKEFIVCHKWKKYGFECEVIQFYRTLHFCGYVGISKEHPFYFKDDDDISLDIDIHGGITFNGKLGNSELWWFGFDCAHGSDWTIANKDVENIIKLHKWTLKEVIEETNKLAKQLTNKEIVMRGLFR